MCVLMWLSSFVKKYPETLMQHWEGLWGRGHFSARYRCAMCHGRRGEKNLNRLNTSLQTLWLAVLLRLHLLALQREVCDRLTVELWQAYKMTPPLIISLIYTSSALWISWMKLPSSFTIQSAVFVWKTGINFWSRRSNSTRWAWVQFKEKPPRWDLPTVHNECPLWLNLLSIKEVTMTEITKNVLPRMNMPPWVKYTVDILHQ